VGRIWSAIAVWGGLTSVAWVVGTLIRMTQYEPAAFVFLLFAGLVYATIVTMALYSRRQTRRATHA
jgi:hypothetical protein